MYVPRMEAYGAEDLDFPDVLFVLGLAHRLICTC